MKLTENRVKSLYIKLLNKAYNLFNKGLLSKSLTYLKAVSYTGYYFYLGYKDDSIESLLQKISNKISRAQESSFTESNSCVFYDSFSIDNGGLVQQYLTAIISIGYKITYITEKKNFDKKDSAIKGLLENYDKSCIKIVPHRLSMFEKAQYVYNTIVNSKPEKLFIHTNPSAVYANAAFYALPKNIIRYKINLTDHTFWAGAGCFDYSFEFRPFGCILSNIERGISKNKIFYLPFYPIMNHVDFQGFPENVKGKIILFSGGAYYKIYDDNDTFFKMVKTILDKCPQTILLYAGIGDLDNIKNKISKYNLENRFILIGQRNDITEVFEHCDIYLNTYPIGGGLMLQYAAQLGKPIVNYYTPNTEKVEEFVCQKKSLEISDNNIEDLAVKIKRLSEDEDFRKTLGATIKECVITPNEFNNIFKQIIETNTNQIAYTDTIFIEEHYLDINDKLRYDEGCKEYARIISKILGIKTIYEAPGLFFDAIKVVIKDNRIIKAIKNNI